MEWLNVIITSAVGVILGLLGWSLKGQYESLREGIQKISAELSAFKDDVLKNYATKPELQKDEMDNKSSHSKMWDEINNTKERVVALETLQKNCRGCSKR